MPNYPVHGYGFDKAAKWLMPAILKKGGLDEDKKDAYEKAIKSRADKGTLGSQYQRKQLPGGRQALQMTPQGLQAEQAFGRTGAEALYDRSGQMREQTQLDTQKKMDDLQEQGFQRNIKKWDGFSKHIEYVQKVSKADMPLDQKNQFIEYTNRMAENLLGIKDLNLHPLDDAATVKEKWDKAAITQMMKVVDGVGKQPTEKGVNRALIAIERAEKYTGNKFESLKQNLKSQMVDQRKKGTLEGQKAETFKTLTPEEKKQVLMKPPVEVKVGEIAEKEKAKERALLKTARFRATIQKDVRALNKDMWIRWTKEQRTDAIRAETDKRVRQTYSDAKYGEFNGRKGWYIQDQKGSWLLVSPWNE